MRHLLKVWALVALLALALPQAALAVATTSVVVTNASWQLLGAGPLQITSNVAITYAISDTPPAILFGGGFKLTANNTVSVNSPSNVYAMATGGAAATVWIAPISASGGGSGGGGAITAPLGAQTPAASVATTINPAVGSTGQTSVSVGITSTSLLAANACTHLMSIIVNPAETQPVWVNLVGGAATTASPSIQLIPGMSITKTSFIPTGAVSAIVAAGTANPVIECN